MSQAKAVSRLSYPKLLKAIKTTVFESRKRIERTFVSMYWTVGKSISEYLDANDGQFPYGQSIYMQLAEDIQIDHRTLYQTVQFYKAYPRLDFKLPLSWSHYRYLSMINAPKERKAWETRIVKEEMSTKEFLQALQAKRNALQRGKGHSQTIPVHRGLLYHYRLVKVNFLNQGGDRIMVDCGFNNRIVAPESDFELANKRIVRSEDIDGDYRIKCTNKTVSEIFTFIGYIERVIDADTINVHVDCGFGLYTNESFRFKGIDAPEISTIAGKRAKKYVEGEMGKVEFVVVKTYWEDKFGRFLADVFYLPGEDDPHAVAEEGTYLNQELIDQGLAKVYGAT